MLDLFENYQAHLDYFIAKGIEVSCPGFYDDERFVKLEQINPNLLNNYASFVNQMTFDNDYLAKAETIIKTTATLLNGELKTDGRQGACIDASMALSRILEKEGIWNYQVKGSLTIEFPQSTNLRKRFFWSVAHGNYNAAHSWIVAPPFKIVDLTVRQQPYKHGEKPFLPDVILKKETKVATLELEDIIEPGLLEALKKGLRNDKAKIMNAISPNLLPFTSRFRPEIFDERGLNFKYLPTGVIAPDLPFEKATSLKLNGLYGIEIYDQVIKPQLSH
jgi:hypothetical protein